MNEELTRSLISLREIKAMREIVKGNQERLWKFYLKPRTSCPCLVEIGKRRDENGTKK